MQTDPFTERPTRISGGQLLSVAECAALQHDHELGLEALARLREAASGCGFGGVPEGNLILWAEDELNLLAGVDSRWGRLDEALRFFRARVPVVSLNTFGFPHDTDDPFEEGSPHLARIGSGVEATAFQSKKDDSIYKFYLPRDGRIGGIFSFVRDGGEVALRAEAELGTYHDLFEKLLLILALDGMPTEVLGATPEGVIVAKQAVGDRLPENADTSRLQPPALIPIPARFLRVARDHPRLYFHRDRPWLIADLHAKNLVRARDTSLRAIDLLASPFPQTLVDTEPLLKDWIERVRLDPSASSLRLSADEEL